MSGCVKIGDFELNSRVILAPMAGITDAAFRQIIREFSKDCLLVTEMLSSEALMWNKEQSIAYCEEFEKPIAFQISGHKPDIMAKAAQKIQKNAAIIDINMGCPVNKIVKNMDGSALMKNPSLAYGIVKAVVEATDKPVSVKFRLGWDANSKNYIKMGEYMQDAGASMITMHARTRTQMYSGSADWSAIKELKKAVDIPVFANGDITSVEKAAECYNLTGCDGVMIGRGILGNPDLIARTEHYFKTGEIISEPDLKTKIDILKRHIDREIFYRGEENALHFMRKFYGHYIRGIKNAASMRDALVREENFSGILKMLDMAVNNG
ncbi:MAG: tRNA dihydrouridine synthase DusB [bacterium]|nr:tRNA dihydrouridine synthase DusB [bacterium]